MSVRSLIQRAAAIHGSEAALGRAAGFSQNAIWQAKRSDRITAEMAVAIHHATDGRVAKWEMRPDLWEPPGLAQGTSSQPQAIAP